MILTHGEERPPARIVQHLAELLEEGLLGVEVRRIYRQDLLELVEDQHLSIRLVPRSCRCAKIEVFGKLEFREPLRRQGRYFPCALLE